MRTITLTQGKVALVDDDLYDELMKFRWYAWQSDKTFYALRNLPRQKVHGKVRRTAPINMHHEVFRLCGKPATKTIDHKNRNGLDNQRRNLRAATTTEQNRNQGKRVTNTSGYIGVTWCKQLRTWKAQARIHGKNKHLGYFDNPRLAGEHMTSSLRSIMANLR
jgi:hypothetical protein